jgi:hypothetical protein
MTCYDDAVRTIIELPEEQLEALDGLCRREAISRAEAIRRAVDLLVRDRAASASHAAFGLWRGARAVDGLKYEERHRREWGAARAEKPLPRTRTSRKRTR